MIYAHCTIGSCILQSYFFTYCFRIDWGMETFCFGIVESPDTTWSAISVRELTMIKNPDSNNVTFKLSRLIRVRYWWFMKF